MLEIPKISPLWIQFAIREYLNQRKECRNSNGQQLARRVQHDQENGLGMPLKEIILIEIEKVRYLWLVFPPFDHHKSG